MIASGIFFVGYNRHSLVVLLSISFFDVLTLTFLLFIFFVSTGLTFYLLINLLSVRLNFLEIIALTFLTNMTNYLGPGRPGAAIKALYLKNQKGLSYAKFSSILAANSFIIFFISGFTGIVLIISLWLQASVLPINLILICILLMLISIFPMIFRFRQIDRKGRIWQTLNNAITGFELIKSQKQKLLAICASVVIQYLISAWVLIIAFHSIGQTLLFIPALIIGVFTSISNFFTITPNNIGVQEIVMAYLYTITGMDFTNGVLGASLMRAIHIVLTFGLAPILVHFMLKSSHFSFSAILLKRKK